MSEKMPERDTTGKCEGECRDRVKEGEEDRQESMKSEDVEIVEEHPAAPGASKRDDPPGSLGGKV
jgi:hypothetical protein